MTGIQRRQHIRRWASHETYAEVCLLAFVPLKIPCMLKKPLTGQLPRADLVARFARYFGGIGDFAGITNGALNQDVHRSYSA